MTGSLLDATDAERGLIGEVVFDPRCARGLTDVVAPQDFADPVLGQLYELAVGMAAAGRHVDAVTFAAEVGRLRAGQQRGQTRWPTVAELASLIGRGAGADARAYAREVAEAALRRAARAAGVRVIQAAEHAPDAAGVLPAGIDDLRAVRDRHTGTGRLRARTLGELLDEVDPGYDWVIPGLLERADRLVVTGDEGAGKSMLLRQLLIAAGAGVHPFTYEPIKPVRGLAVDVENSERQWRRHTSGLVLMAARNGSADPRETVHVECTGRLDITQPATLADVHRLLDEHDPELLLIGPLYKLVPRAITTDDDAAPLITALDSIRDRGVTLLLEAHAGHVKGSAGSRDLRPRGSAALLGWPEFGFGLGWSTDDTFGDVPAVDVVRWRGDRDERQWPTQMYRGGPFPWTDRNAPDGPRRAMYGQHTTVPAGAR